MPVGIIGRTLGLGTIAFFLYSALFYPSLILLITTLFLIAITLSLVIKFFA